VRQVLKFPDVFLFCLIPSCCVTSHHDNINYPDYGTPAKFVSDKFKQINKEYLKKFRSRNRQNRFDSPLNPDNCFFR